MTGQRPGEFAMDGGFGVATWPRTGDPVVLDGLVAGEEGMSRIQCPQPRPQDVLECSTDR